MNYVSDIKILIDHNFYKVDTFETKRKCGYNIMTGQTINKLLLHICMFDNSRDRLAKFYKLKQLRCKLSTVELFDDNNKLLLENCYVINAGIDPADVTKFLVEIYYENLYNDDSYKGIDLSE